jgi:basic amino acid/polyamine antiporter, APA family
MIAQKYTKSVAVNMVIANMIGTGIFTSLGYQVLPNGIPDPFAILFIWLLGGIIALCGATVYAEIATTVNESGGEYTFLSKLYHPILGFVSGWISILVGFSSAIAVLAIATGEYFSPILGIEKDTLILGVPYVNFFGALMIVLVSVIHLRGVRFGGNFQNYATYVKLTLIFIFLLLPFLYSGDFEHSDISFLPTEKSWDTIFSLPFAGALVWVMFAYSGWNASTYIVGSLENPKKNIPYSLLFGTLIVTVLYVLLNFVFMYSATFDQLAFKTDLGNVVAQKILGSKLSLLFSGVFSFALISGLSAMFIAGPKVIETMGKDYSIFKFLGKQSLKGTPNTAIILMMSISIVLALFVDFKNLVEYTGFTLSIFSLLTVSSIFLIRIKKISGKNVVRAWGYPLSPIVFISLNLWMIYSFINTKPEIVWWFIITLVPGFVIYFFSKK